MLACLLLCFFGQSCCLAAESVIVEGSGSYSSIQSALDAAVPGSTILVYSGTYNEDLHVDKRVTLKGVDNGGGMPVIYGSGAGDVITITADGVRIEGFVVKNSEKYASAILVESSDNEIVGNTITECNEGIRLDQGDRNLVRGNTLVGNNGDGIYIHYSDGNTITDNRAKNNEFGIQGYNLRNNVISDNHCEGNTGIDMYFEQISNSVISNNRIEGNEESSRSGGDGIGMRYGSNVTIRDNYVGKHYYGIKVYYSDTTTVSNNTVENSGVNIRFDFGTHDSVISNNTVRNGVDNILVAGESSNIFIEYNLVSNGKDSIYLFGSGDNIIRHNNVYDSTYGIRLYKSTDNLIIQNYLHDNEYDIYPSGTGSTVRDNDRRANYYGEEPKVSPTPTSTVDASAVPSPRPGEDEDFFSWLWRIISSLLSL
ncbi:hypothetical protein RCIX1943 [Methanocella arvoryzae MRE50]|uniref:Carbohydrate-binding/sugar hydrolysis domain-containing protein n=1 Tax=Methanocella arvoryzae (strain DSM 22066 / NBRC 105507 / MRE50) TaxID=351160 RepID=Q0W3D6_METAR|nr:hypothetical protein RCIX1943 [Methanocella arvoryzae MRE50]